MGSSGSQIPQPATFDFCGGYDEYILLNGVYIFIMAIYKSYIYPFIYIHPFIDGLPVKNGDFPWLC